MRSALGTALVFVATLVSVFALVLLVSRRDAGSPERPNFYEGPGINVGPTRAQCYWSSAEGVVGDCQILGWDFPKCGEGMVFEIDWDGGRSCVTRPRDWFGYEGDGARAPSEED